jgi:uncharacterized protein YwgA
MTQVQRQAVFLSLIDALQRHGSWCGETHIQKSAYFVQEVFGVPLDFNFILYKHGPYSFDLNDELTALRADQLLTVQPAGGYGAHLYPGPEASAFLARFPQTVRRYARAVETVAGEFGKRTVAELERLATALYVLRNFPTANDDEQAARINQFKPHVAVPEARAAITAVREFIDRTGGAVPAA